MMKRLIYILPLLFLVFACAGNAEFREDDREEMRLVDMTLTGLASKSQMVGDGVIVWNDGDRISVLDAAGNHEFITDEGGSTAQFHGKALEGADRVYALYPYEAAASCSLEEGRIRAFIPAAQTGVRNSFADCANVVAARVENGSFVAEAACGLLKLTLSRDDVMSVDVVSRNDKILLAGTAVLDMESAATPVVKVENGSHIVSLNGCGKALGGGVFYLDAVPCTLDGGYDIRVALADGRVSVTAHEGPLEISRGGIADLGTVDGTLNVTAESYTMYFYDAVSDKVAQPFTADIPTSVSYGPDSYTLVQHGRELPFQIYSQSGYSLFRDDNRKGLKLTSEPVSAWIKLPAIEGKALKFVTLASGTNVQSFMRYRVCPDLEASSTSNPIAYLDLYGGGTPVAAGMEVPGETGKSYYLYVTSNSNATLHSVTLVYEDASPSSGPHWVKARSQYRGETSWTMVNETWTVDDLPGFCPSGNPETDEYGGWTGTFSFEPTGWFRCEKRGKRWWMVDPLGNPFISAGICSFKLYTRNAPFNDAYKALYGGDEQRWAIGEWKKLNSYGFNSFGAFCQEPVIKRNLKVPYVLTLTPMDDYLQTVKDGYVARYGEDCWKDEGPFNFPLVFDEAFEHFCETVFAKAWRDGYLTDKYMLGIMTDNEFPVNYDFLSKCLGWPDKEHPNYKEAVAWLSANGLTAAEALASLDAERRFAAYCYGTYLKKVSSALHKYDTNHLYMGTKATGSNWMTALLNKYVFNAAAPYVDVFSIDYYGSWAPRPDVLRDWSERCGKPIVFAEWYVKGEDVSLAQPDVYSNVDGVGWTVPTQKDRGYYYQNYVLQGLESGVVVGWHWFKYCDGHPAEKIAGSGYYSSDNCNKGVESVSMELYTECLEQMKRLNDQIYPLCLYYDSK